jgi:hypothetical protein
MIFTLMLAMSANVRITFEDANEAAEAGLPPDFTGTWTKGRFYECDLWMDGRLDCAWQDGFSIDHNSERVLYTTTN